MQDYDDTVQNTFTRLVMPRSQTITRRQDGSLALISHSNNTNVGLNAHGPIAICADSGGLGSTRAYPYRYLNEEAIKVIKYTRTINPLPPIRLGKRGKPKPQDWQRYWSARCAEIITLADDHVRRKKELRKVQGALKAALAKADMMEAEQLRRVIRENLSFDDIPDCNVADPESDSDSAGQWQSL